MNCCRIADLRHKEGVNIKDGTCLGCVNDVEIDTCNARLVAIVIYGKLKCFGLFGRQDDIVIRWEDIEVVGEDTILVCHTVRCNKKKRNRFWNSLFTN